jgi:hypothetical protein
MFFLYGVEERSWKKWLALTAECQRRLTEQQITPDYPGTILKDVQTLLEFVGPEGIVTKSRNASLPAERLAELNAKMSHPVELTLKRALLKDYPNVAGIFILLRVLELLEMKGKRLVVCPAGFEFWRRLNTAEQYFALLEALLFNAQSSVLGGERTREDPQCFEPVTAFLSQLSDRWRNFHDYEMGSTFGFHGELPPWKLFVQQQLGLIELRAGKPSERDRWDAQGWLPGGARLTDWGEAVAWALIQFLKTKNEEEESDAEEAAPDAAGLQIAFGEWEKAEEGEEEEIKAEEHEAEPEFGILQPVFQPYFPEWQTVFARPAREARTGTHLFKVRLGGWRGDGSIWRRLAVPPDTSLDSLAGVILDAFDFDEDHMYDFRYRDQRGRSRVYHHPYCDEGPWTSQLTVGESDLAIGDEMLFTFDYGDNWEFDVRLEEVETGRCKLKRPKVIESAGKAPEQYPQYEE